jgi:hypothetical protein
MTTDTSWVVEGATVALVSYVITSGGSGRRPTGVKTATVAKVTDKRITLDDGTKLDPHDLSVIGDGGGSWRTQWTEAKHPTNPAVVDARASIRARNVGKNLPDVFAEVHDLDDARRALAAAEAMLDDLRGQLDRLTR